MDKAKIHLTGAISHGERKYYAFGWTSAFTDDSNVTFHVLLHTLKEYAKVGYILLIFNQF